MIVRRTGGTCERGFEESDWLFGEMWVYGIYMVDYFVYATADEERDSGDFTATSICVRNVM